MKLLIAKALCYLGMHVPINTLWINKRYLYNTSWFVIKKTEKMHKCGNCLRVYQQNKTQLLIKTYYK